MHMVSGDNHRGQTNPARLFYRSRCSNSVIIMQGTRLIIGEEAVKAICHFRAPLWLAPPNARNVNSVASARSAQRCRSLDCTGNSTFNTSPRSDEMSFQGFFCLEQSRSATGPEHSHKQKTSEVSSIYGHKSTSRCRFHLEQPTV